MNKFSAVIQGHQYAYGQALRYLRKAWLGAVMTLLVIAIALSLPFSLLLISRYANQVFAELGQHAQIVLYLQPGVDAKTVEAMKTKLSHYRSISAVRYISPEAGLKQLAARQGFKEVLEELDENPLPGVLEIQPLPDLNPKEIDELAKSLKELPWVDQNYVNTASVKEVLTVLAVVKRFIVALAFLLGISVMLIVGNTLRLIILQHTEEIQVMRLVGASQAYTRRPYLYMGVLLGALGGLVAWLMTFSLFSYLNAPLSALQGMYEVMLFSIKPGFFESVLFLLTCVFLAWASAMIAAKRFCRAA